MDVSDFPIIDISFNLFVIPQEMLLGYLQHHWLLLLWGMDWYINYLLYNILYTIERKTRCCIYIQIINFDDI